MTQAERDVIDAAREAVHSEKSGNVVTADMVTDPAKLAALVRAVMRLKWEREALSYWR